MNCKCNNCNNLRDFLIKKLDGKIERISKLEKKLKKITDYPIWAKLEERKKSYKIIKNYLENLYELPKNHPTYPYTRKGFMERTKKYLRLNKEE